MRGRALALLAAALVRAGSAGAADPPAAAWSFAVSGDSRDCGDLVMPKIARAVREEPAPGVAFFWHLGDLRRIYDIDCDVLVRKHPDFDCKGRAMDAVGDAEMAEYEATAFADFVEKQLKPFGDLPVLVGIGNHELYGGRTRGEFVDFFRPWLSQKRLHLPRLDDGKREFPDPGRTSYHWVERGVEFIYLDNADEAAFTPNQLLWLQRVLADDLKSDQVKTIVLGTHEALPFSKYRIHAMDASCQGICSGQQAYDLLSRAAAKKRVYLFSSHAHTFVADAYETPEHRGQVLPGWIIGTAGAIQSGERIRYGYLRVDVSPEGVLTPVFREVGRSSPPLAEGPGAANLTEFCFTQNIRKQVDDSEKADCACGAVTAK